MHIADELRQRPGLWAVIMQGGPMPSEDAPNMPSRPILEAAREIWSASGSWAPLGAFDVAIRDNELYVVALESPRTDLSPMNYVGDRICFECGRPGVYLSHAFATIVCGDCGLELLSDEAEDPKMMRFADVDG